MQKRQCATHKRLLHKLPTVCAVLCRKLTWSTNPGISLSWEAYSLSLRPESPCLSWNIDMFSLFTRSSHWNLRWACLILSTCSYRIFRRSVLALIPHVCLHLPTATFTSPNFCMHTSHLPYMLHAQPISYSVIRSPYRVAFRKKMRYIINSWGQLANYQIQYIIQSLTLFKKMYRILWVWVLVQGGRSVFTLTYPECCYQGIGQRSL